MAEQPSQSFHAHGPELPPERAAALRAIYEARVEVPAAVDRAILGDAREGFGRRRRFRMMVRWAGAAAAAAAAVVVVAVNLYRHRPPTNIAVAPVVGDVDGNGRVDMLDAFALAKKVD